MSSEGGSKALLQEATSGLKLERLTRSQRSLKQDSQDGPSTPDQKKSPHAMAEQGKSPLAEQDGTSGGIRSAKAAREGSPDGQEALPDKKGTQGLSVQCPLNEYEKMRIKFQKHGQSFQTLKALKRISHQFNYENSELNKLPILKSLIQITNQLMMNELEIVYWNMINKEIDLLEVKNHQFIEMLMMTALQAKRVTCEPHMIQVFEAFLGHNYPQFMLNYEVWKSNLAEVSESGFDAVNESFRYLYADSQAYREADTVQDLNFMVDSLEDEHVRRTVHTTKTIAEIEEENKKLAADMGSDQANLIAAIFFRKRGRGRHRNNEASYSRSQINRQRKASADDSATPKRSRSRSINTQTDDRDMYTNQDGGGQRRRKHSQQVNMANISPRNIRPHVQQEADPDFQDAQYLHKSGVPLGVPGGGHTIIHMPPGGGPPMYQTYVPFPMNINTFNFPSSNVQVSAGGAPPHGYYAYAQPNMMHHSPQNQGKQQQTPQIQGPFYNDHLNLMHKINQQQQNQKEVGPAQPAQKQLGTPAFLPTFNLNVQSGESFGGGHPNFQRSLAAFGIDPSMSMELRRGISINRDGNPQPQGQEGSNTKSQQQTSIGGAPYFPGQAHAPQSSSLGASVMGFFNPVLGGGGSGGGPNSLQNHASGATLHGSKTQPSFPPSLQSSITKHHLMSTTAAYPPQYMMHQPHHYFSMFSGPAHMSSQQGGGGLPDFGGMPGGSLDRGSFPSFYVGPQPKSGSFECSPNSSFIKVMGGNQRNTFGQPLKLIPTQQQQSSAGSEASSGAKLKK